MKEHLKRNNYPQVKIDSPQDRNPRLPIAEWTPPICRPHYGNEFGFDARRGYKYMQTWDRAARVLAYFKPAITRPGRPGRPGRQGCLCRVLPFLTHCMGANCAESSSITHSSLLIFFWYTYSCQPIASAAGRNSMTQPGF